jgi:hypothetical protein
MKFVSRLSVAALSVVAVGSGLMSMTNVAIAAPAPGSWDQSIQGEGIAVAGQFSIKINTNVWSDVNGTAFGSMFYERNDGFRMYANAECSKTFQQGKVATIAGPIAKKVGVGSQGDDGNWMYYEINSTAGIRVLTLSKEAALKYCNQPTGEFPGTFTSGGVTIKLNRQIRPIPRPIPGIR